MSYRFENSPNNEPGYKTSTFHLVSFLFFSCCFTKIKTPKTNHANLKIFAFENTKSILSSQ